MAPYSINTRWTVIIIEVIESILSLTCFVVHVTKLINTGIMTGIGRNVLFCGTFGGLFILSVCILTVTICGIQTPEIDSCCTMLAYVLFYTCSILSWQYFKVQLPKAVNAPSLYVSCWILSLLSLVTGSFFLMHFMISIDRVLHEKQKGKKKSIELNKNEDIPPTEKFELKCFLVPLGTRLYKTKRCKKLRKKCKCKCRCKEQEEVEEEVSSSEEDIQPTSRWYTTENW